MSKIPYFMELTSNQVCGDFHKTWQIDTRRVVAMQHDSYSKIVYIWVDNRADAFIVIESPDEIAKKWSEADPWSKDD